MTIGVDVADDFGGAFAQWGAAEASGAYGGHISFGGGEVAAADGGVGCHYACEAGGGYDVYDVIELLIGEVGGYFEEYGFFASAFFVHGLKGIEELHERFFVLQGAEAGGVGAADVDHEIVYMVVEGEEAFLIVFGGVFVGGVFVLAYVATYYNALFAAAKAAGSPGSAIVVEAHAVDEGAVGWETEEAGFGVAGLRAWSYGANLYKAEPEAGE